MLVQQAQTAMWITSKYTTQGLDFDTTGEELTYVLFRNDLIYIQNWFWKMCRVFPRLLVTHSLIVKDKDRM